jgi:mRNA-degrading endonuclease RelE of RelBE toxin-antitoxin system
MKYSIVVEQQAKDDLSRLRAFDQRKIMDSIQELLSANPTQISKSRIKRLRGVDSPQFRLRVNGFRVFYDVEDEQVRVLRVLPKEAVQEYLEEMGYEIENR